MRFRRPLAVSSELCGDGHLVTRLSMLTVVSQIRLLPSRFGRVAMRLWAERSVSGWSSPQHSTHASQGILGELAR